MFKPCAWYIEERQRGTAQRGTASESFSGIFSDFQSFFLNQHSYSETSKTCKQLLRSSRTISLLSVTPPPFSKYSAIGGHEPLEPLRAHTGRHNSCTFLCSLCSRECLPWRQRPSESKRHRDSAAAAAVLCKRASWLSRCHKADATETVLNLGEKE